MNAAVCVPWRPGDAAREQVWAYVRAWWERTGLPVFAADCDADRFSVARARNLAAAKAGDWDAALFVDADVVLDDPAQAHAAVAAATAGRAYVAAYTTFRWLDEAATGRLLDGHPAHAEGRAGTWLNAFAIGRPLWDALGGFDPVRFPGIGGEDVSLVARVDEVDGHFGRVAGEAYHLWHPPRESRWSDA